MPHMPKELWAYYTQPLHLAVLASLGLLLFGVSLLYWLSKSDLRRRQRLLKFLLAFHFAFWATLAYTFFLFLESAVEGDSFRLIDYSFAGLRIALGLPIMLAFFLSLAVTSLGGQRLQRNLLTNLASIATAPALQHEVDKLAWRAGLKKVKLVIEDTPATYSVTLYGRPPIILLTRGLTEFLDAEELRAVMAHELAHISHHDCHYKLMASILARFFYFDPLTRRLRISLCRDREYLADEAAARLTGNPLALATALLKLTHPRIPSGHRPSPLLASSLALFFIGGPEAAALQILGSEGDWRTDHPPPKARVRRLLEIYLELNRG